MSRRLLLPLALLVTALLVVAALASRGRPLGGGGYGGGPSTGFFDYAFTTVVVVGVVLFAAMIWGWLTNRPELQRRAAPRSRLLASLLFLLGCTAIAWLMSTGAFRRRLHLGQHALQQPAAHKRPGSGADTTAKQTHVVQIRWDEVAIVLALLTAAGVFAYASRTRQPPASRLARRRASQAAVSAALDESLDDLRREPDLRKAIIAAYARMERALAIAGLPRRPAEAPLEYVERALAELETSADAARRLTDLFEWAKFSHHEPAAHMRDEAIDALVAVRDELRRPAGETVAA